MSMLRWVLILAVVAAVVVAPAVPVSANLPPARQQPSHNCPCCVGRPGLVIEACCGILEPEPQPANAQQLCPCPDGEGKGRCPCTSCPRGMVCLRVDMALGADVRTIDPPIHAPGLLMSPAFLAIGRPEPIDPPPRV